MANNSDKDSKWEHFLDILEKSKIKTSEHPTHFMVEQGERKSRINRLSPNNSLVRVRRDLSISDTTRLLDLIEQKMLLLQRDLEVLEKTGDASRVSNINYATEDPYGIGPVIANANSLLAGITNRKNDILQNDNPKYNLDEKSMYSESLKISNILTALASYLTTNVSQPVRSVYGAIQASAGEITVESKHDRLPNAMTKYESIVSNPLYSDKNMTEITISQKHRIPSELSVEHTKATLKSCISTLQNLQGLATLYVNKAQEEHNIALKNIKTLQGIY